MLRASPEIPADAVLEKQALRHRIAIAVVGLFSRGAFHGGNQTDGQRICLLAGHFLADSGLCHAHILIGGVGVGRKVAEKCHHIVPGEKNSAVLLLGGGLRIQPVMAADEKFSGLLGDPVYIFAGEGDLP